MVNFSPEWFSRNNQPPKETTEKTSLKTVKQSARGGRKQRIPALQMEAGVPLRSETNAKINHVLLPFLLLTVHTQEGEEGQHQAAPTETRVVS